MDRARKHIGHAARYTAYGLCLLSGFLAASTIAQAALLPPKSGNAFPKTNLNPQPFSDSKEPVLLSASRIDYDQENSIVVATGKVEVTQGETILIADVLSYDQPRNTVKAKGNVSMLEASGNVVFADELTLRNDMKTGVIEQFKARLSDNSVLVAAKARKIDENRTELFKAAYTPCHCEEGKEPQWAVKADHLLVDQGENRLYYDNAYLAAFGVPILYTPYLSHPTPDAGNESGLLTPEYRHSSNLGSVFKVPLYWAIAPDKDMTITPMPTSAEGLVMIGEYRQKFDSGRMQFNGSITQPQRRDALGNPSTDTETRGHIDAVGAFSLTENYDWGFDIHRTTDDTYLRRYGFNNNTQLTSRIYTEGYNFVGTNDRTYGNVEALAFQGLTAQDEGERIPVVVPRVNFTMQSDPNPDLYNSRFTFDGNIQSLFRREGADSQRLSTTVGWKLPYISDSGQVIEFNTQLRSDVYAVNDVLLSNNTLFEGTNGRVVPQASVLWRYPFIKQWGESSSLILEPIVQLTVSPNGGNPEEIPNEDSLVPEFTDSNLFSTDRFAGYDRIESGQRIAYGLRGQAQLYSDKYVDWLIGQNYRTKTDRNFPFTNDLDSHFSDFVGKVGIAYQPVYLAYRFRLDKESFSALRNELDATVNYYPITMSLSYLELKNDPILANKQNIGGYFGVNLSRNWTWNNYGTHDIELHQTTSAATGFTYKNECTEIITLLGREYTRDRDLEPSTSFLMRLSLKNLE